MVACVLICGVVNRFADGAVIVVVCVVVVSVAPYLACDGVITVPVVRVVAVPVISTISVMAWPVAAQAYEDVLAVVVRVNVSERKP